MERQGQPRIQTIGAPVRCGLAPRADRLGPIGPAGGQGPAGDQGLPGAPGQAGPVGPDGRCASPDESLDGLLGLHQGNGAHGGTGTALYLQGQGNDRGPGWGYLV